MADPLVKTQHTNPIDLHSEVQPSPSWIRVVESESISVGIADGAIATGGQLRTSGLGSCVAIVLYEEDASIASLIHPMLPTPEHPQPDEPGRYVTTALDAQLAALEAVAVDTAKLKAGVIGGAQMLDFSSSPTSIGDRNISIADQWLESAAIPITTRDVGGNTGRSVIYDIDNNELDIRHAGT